MEKIHTTQPEAVVFLELAAGAMEQYKQTHGAYPAEWHLMDITFASGPYRMSDQGIRPSKELKNVWKPKNCQYTYVIKSASKNEFAVHALNEQGITEYEMRQGMSTPQKK